MTWVRYETREQIAEIILQREPVNALTEAMLDDVIAGLARAAADASVRAVILSSAIGGRFCAGIDLQAVASGDADVRALVQKLYVGVHDAQAALGKPSIAAISGAARGGGMTLALSCDLVLAGHSATFGYPEIEVGVIPAIHYAHLPRTAGRYRAFDLLFTGRSFDAAEAADLGLVSRLVDDDRVVEEARALATMLASKSAHAMRFGRETFRRVNDAEYRKQIQQAVDDFCAIANTPEALAAMHFFLTKGKSSSQR